MNQRPCLNYVTCSSNFIQYHWMVLGTQKFQHHPMQPSKACEWIQDTLYVAVKYTDWKLNQHVNPFQQGLPVIHFCSFWKGRRSVLKDCCAIADNTVLPPETVVPPFTLYSGSPGKCSYSLVEYDWCKLYPPFLPYSQRKVGIYINGFVYATKEPK